MIVQDLDAAIAMAGKYRSRFKIVTLDGQVLNPGGSMTGGSVNKESGILSRDNELEKLTVQEKTLEQKQAVTEADWQEAKRQTEQVAFQLTAARDQLREAEDQVLRLQGVEKQREIILQSITEAESSARREETALKERCRTDGERPDGPEGQNSGLWSTAGRDQGGAAIAGRQPVGNGGGHGGTFRADDPAENRPGQRWKRKNPRRRPICRICPRWRSAMEGDREKKLALRDSIEADSARAAAGAGSSASAAV